MHCPHCNVPAEQTPSGMACPECGRSVTAKPPSSARPLIDASGGALSHLDIWLKPTFTHRLRAAYDTDLGHALGPRGAIEQLIGSEQPIDGPAPGELKPDLRALIERGVWHRPNAGGHEYRITLDTAVGRFGIGARAERGRVTLVNAVFPVHSDMLEECDEQLSAVEVAYLYMAGLGGGRGAAVVAEA